MKIIDKIKDFFTSRKLVKVGFLIGAIVTFFLGIKIAALALICLFIGANFDSIVDIIKGLFKSKDIKDTEV